MKPNFSSTSNVNASSIVLLMNNALTFKVNKAMKKELEISFGQWLKPLIANLAKSQAEVAREAGITDVQLSRIVTGNSGVKRDNAIRIIDAINKFAGHKLADKTEGLELAGYSSNEEDAERIELETMYKKRKALTGKRKESFANLLDMVDRELDRMYSEEIAQQSGKN